jgi:mono/diheme cytochrome c family protein
MDTTRVIAATVFGLTLAVAVAACGAAPTATPVPPPTPTHPLAITTPTTSLSTSTTPGQVSFAKDVLPIFQKNCTRCHGGGNPRAGLSLESYAQAMAGSSQRAVIVPGSPDDSQVVKLIRSGAMPRGGPRLSDADIETIAAWIKGGAPNN